MEIVSQYRKGGWIAQVGWNGLNYTGRFGACDGITKVSWFNWVDISHKELSYIDKQSNRVEKKYAEIYMDICS